MGKLYVVRHADAGTRGPNDGPDALRPLIERGRRQADGLRDQLADLGIGRLVASPFRRCIDTMQPLADHLGLEVESDDRLAEGQGFAGALAIADEVADGDAVFCSHGDVIPDLLDALLRQGMKVKQDLRWQKASTWVFTRDGDGFSKGVYLPPPV